MLLSLAIIFLVGLSAAEIFQKIKLPRIIGMLSVGILTGPFVLDWLDPSILEISSELRQIALIIILIKAGLSLNLSDLKKVGRPAIMMSFVPACFEIIGYLCFAPSLLVTWCQSNGIGYSGSSTKCSFSRCCCTPNGKTD